MAKGRSAESRLGARGNTYEDVSPVDFPANNNRRFSPDPADDQVDEKHTEVPRRDSCIVPKVSPQDKEDGIFLAHPGTELETVACDMTEVYPDESFCFLNEAKLRERAQELQKFFLPGNERGIVAYAVKANAKGKILRVLADEGIDHYDCASPEEIRVAKSYSPHSEILYNHPVKSTSAILGASRRGIAHYTVQSHREIDKIDSSVDRSSMARPLELAVRLSTPNDNAAINLSTKFGCQEKDAREMIRRIRSQIHALPGISIHTGSQNEDPDVYVGAIKKISAIAIEEGGVHTMNVGGGLPVNYHANDTFSVRHYLDVISRALEEYSRYALRGDDPKIILEVGRIMVAECIDLMIPVLAVENRNRGRCIYINDGVYTSFSDFVVHDWPYNFLCRGKNGKKLSEKCVPFEVFGRTCDSGDSLGQIVLPENLDEGDYLWLKNAGAYMDSQGGHFNGFGMPHYIAYNR